MNWSCKSCPRAPRQSSTSWSLVWLTAQSRRLIHRCCSSWSLQLRLRRPVNLRVHMSATIHEACRRCHRPLWVLSCSVTIGRLVCPGRRLHGVEICSLGCRIRITAFLLPDNLCAQVPVSAHWRGTTWKRPWYCRYVFVDTLHVTLRSELGSDVYQETPVQNSPLRATPRTGRRPRPPRCAHL